MFLFVFIMLFCPIVELFDYIILEVAVGETPSILVSKLLCEN